MWFLERQIRRTRPEWLRAYHYCLASIPVFFVMLWFALSGQPNLSEETNLFWRITQHAGSQILPGISSHLLVATHVFLESIHYFVWILLIPLVDWRAVPWKLDRDTACFQTGMDFQNLWLGQLQLALLLVVGLVGRFCDRLYDDARRVFCVCNGPCFGGVSVFDQDALMERRHLAGTDRDSDLALLRHGTSVSLFENGCGVRAGKMPVFICSFLTTSILSKLKACRSAIFGRFCRSAIYSRSPIETPVLLVGLSRKVSFKQKLWCGVWLTACTYPIVILVLPAIFFGQSRALYLTIAETFAPVGECFLFWLAFRGKDLLETPDWVRCLIAIIIANLASFAGGEVLNYYGWFGLF